MSMPDQVVRSSVKRCLSLMPYAIQHRWLGGLLVERRTSVSQIRGSIPGQVAAV